CIGNLRPSPHPIRSLYLFHLLFSILRPPPDPTLFPYTTLFRSAVYASFGRMYTLLAFAGALAADTFVRALDLRTGGAAAVAAGRSEEHTSELQSRENLVCRLLLEKKKRLLSGRWWVTVYWILRY